MTFFSTKTYDHSEGLSCTFRQWRATHSHCSYLHGYALKVKITFGCATLDERNWCQDFGGLKKFRNWLHDMFDHTTIVAKDDPLLQDFYRFAELYHRDGVTGPGDVAYRYDNLEAYGGGNPYGKAMKLRVVDAVGMEKFAEMIGKHLNYILQDDDANLNKTVYVYEVEVSEHGGNSAIWQDS